MNLQPVIDAWNRGWSVIPVRADKKPAFRWKSYQEQRPSFDQLQIWSTQFNPSGWAVICGAVSKMICLDFDGAAGAITLATLGLEPHVRTGSGGSHVYCTHPGIPVQTVNSRSKRALAEAYPGLDFRGDGGYAIFTGENAKGRYETLRPLDDLVPFESLPANLRSWLTVGAHVEDGVSGAVRRFIEKAVQDASGSGRNEAGFWLCCQLRDLGLDQDRAHAILATDYRMRLNGTNLKGAPEAYTDTEISATVREVWKRSPRPPPRSSNVWQRGTVAQQPDDPVHLTDLGNATRMIDLHGADLRYCHLWSRWLVWDGARFKPDETGEIHRLARHTVAMMYQEAARIGDENVRKALATHAMRSESAGRLEAMISLAQSDHRVVVTPDELDRHPWLLNCPNGTVDLRTGVIRDAQREDLLTKQTAHPCAPLDTGSPDRWVEFVLRILDDRTPLFAFMHRALGYAVTGSTAEQVIFILHGNGANGKSTLLDAILSIIGDYGCYTPASSLQAQRGESIPNDLARLKGHRVVAAMEMDEGRRLAEALVKQMTGREKIAARFMRGEWFEFAPEFTIFLATNHRPEIRGTDHAIWRRIRLVPFNVTIPPEEQDRDLPGKLLEEAPAILAWLVRGALLWQEEGLGHAPEVDAATQEFREEQDGLGEFLASFTESSPGDSVSSTEMYSAYSKWCDSINEKPVPKRGFANRMKDRGLTAVKGHANRTFWQGVRLSGSGYQGRFSG